MTDPVATPADQQQAPEAQQQEAPVTKTYDQAYVDQLRQEAAGHRVGKKEAVEAAEAAVRAEYEAKLADRDVAYTELQNQLGQAWIELEKVYTSIEAKVPSDKVRQFAAILTGEDKESIEASAKTSFELFGGFETKSPAFDPTQGTGGRNTLPLNGDPLLNAVKGVLGVK
ncbi:scaffolding protein [Gordonia phage Switzerland]|uniref:head scaffolding protein n=1 Tax=Gordonia phage JSwag TaxID=1887649 RepID=UPI00084EF0FD|nr:head scaffolding protein [Gordonia phage JSwag]AOE44427.1 scaffolding protein [Gordonia phage JSwag]UOK18070.1 scaffolding protein [Gordonia phage Switzerland]WIC40109.1 scaffolding protein [Gordonia phage Battleship]